MAAISLLGENSEAYSLWMEMEEGRTPEAKFVRAMDRVDMSLRAIDYVRMGDLKLEQAMEFINYSKKNFETLGFPQLCGSVNALVASISPNLHH